MIKYAVQCEKAHAFEGWFQNSSAFDKQARRGLIVCPKCGSVKISKQLMAPNVSSKTRKKGADANAAPVRRGKSQAANLPASQVPTEMLELMRKVRKEVEANAEHVGDKFAEEARKMHYNETPARGIYGEASLDDVKSLHEEGIDCLPLPVLPEDQN